MLHVSNAKWTPSDEQEGRENGLESSQTGSVTRGGTFETKDKSMNHLPKTLRSGMWQRSRWAGDVTVLHCWDRVNGENRQKLFSGFYSLGSYDLQNTNLIGCIKVLPIKCRYGASNRRRYSCQYYVNVGGEFVRVCQKTFLSIHAVSHGRVD